MAPQGNRRPGFSRRAQYGRFIAYVIAAVGALIALVFVLISVYNPGAYAPLRAGVREVTTPVSSGLAEIRRGLGTVPAAISEHFRVVSQNRKLRKALEAREILVQKASTIERENERLRALVRLRDRQPGTVVAARIVSSSASSTRRYAVLNAGWRQGVREGQPVRGPQGLIGRVLETGPDTARILLILDPESIVPVRRSRDGMPAIVAGRGDGLVDIRAASMADAPFLAGDSFVTSGTGGLYEPGVPVARVMRNARDTAVAQVYASPDSSDFALVQQIFMPARADPAQNKTPEQ